MTDSANLAMALVAGLFSRRPRRPPTQKEMAEQAKYAEQAAWNAAVDERNAAKDKKKAAQKATRRAAKRKGST